MLISTPLTVEDINYFDSHTRDMYGTSHSDETCLLFKTTSMHKFVKYFNTIYNNKDKDLLKSIHIAAFNVYLF